MKHIQSNPPSKAWVVFCPESEIWWLRFLKPGFKHCFVIVSCGDHWVSVDPLSTYTELRCLENKILPEVLDELSKDNIVIETLLNHDAVKPQTVGIFSCVSVVKKILGIQNRWIFTPWQLAKCLTNPQS